MSLKKQQFQLKKLLSQVLKKYLLCIVYFDKDKFSRRFLVSILVFLSRKIEKPVKITLLPYYGGAKGNTLQIMEMPDGKINTSIIKTPSTEASTDEPSTTPVSDIENPELPSKNDTEYSESIRNIHRTALNIIRLQDAVKVFFK